MISDQTLRAMADELAALPDVVGVMLGGSRARGDQTESSDVDLGLYYRGDLDVDRVRDLARRFGGPDADVTAVGGWGPWVNGGGWLQVDRTPVDWLYRDLDRVDEGWERIEAGEPVTGRQLGHVFGTGDVGYVGEVALGRPLADPSGELTGRYERYATMPAALRRRLVADLDQGDFLLSASPKGAARTDVAFVAGNVFYAVMTAAYAVCGASGRWVINEKGAVRAADRLPSAPVDFAERVARLTGELGRTPEELRATVDATGALLAEVRRGCLTTLQQSLDRAVGADR